MCSRLRVADRGGFVCIMPVNLDEKALQKAMASADVAGPSAYLPARQIQRWANEGLLNADMPRDGMVKLYMAIKETHFPTPLVLVSHPNLEFRSRLDQCGVCELPSLSFV